jgi:Sulfatase
MAIKSTTLVRNLGTLLATVGIFTFVHTAFAQSPTSPSPGGSLSLPRPDFHFKGQVGRTYQDSDPATFPQIVRAPKGAPNIVLILLDDVGFGQFNVFGGGVSSPNMEKLAAQGLRYNRFHTTALCSPTRAALITGRNHHMSGNGSITEAATGYDGYTGIIPKSAGTVAEILRQNGYATAWVGKNHNTPVWETSEIGPFDRWANGLGFDYFYGFNAGDTSQYEPILFENRNRVPRSNDPPITSPPTSPTTRLPGCRRSKSSTRIGHFSSMSRRPRPTRRIRRRKSGSTSSKASSTWAGTATAR